MRLCLLLLLMLAACAAPHRPEPSVAAAGNGRATILAVRPIVPSETVLTLIGTGPAASRSAVAGRREYVLRTDSGKIISIVADDDARWRAGQAMSVTFSDPPASPNPTPYR